MGANHVQKRLEIKLVKITLSAQNAHTHKIPNLKKDRERTIDYFNYIYYQNFNKFHSQAVFLSSWALLNEPRTITFQLLISQWHNGYTQVFFTSCPETDE